jgi:gliding motility-associated-like protein
MHGTLVLNSNGIFNYIPDLNYTGLDQFVYRVCDNGTPQACAQATVYLMIAPFNQAPIAVNDILATNEDSPVNGDVSINDTPSKDGENVWTILQQADHGNVIIETNGKYTYTPAPNFYGVDQFKYMLCDIDQDCSEATVTITVRQVNDGPVANDDFVTLQLNGILNASAGVNDFPGRDGGNVWSLVNTPDSGTLVFNADGSYTYTPSLNFVGKVTFTYKLCDAEGECSQANVTITVEDVIVANQILSPNGDGQNDTFYISGVELYPSSKLTVFNRWGNVVYEKIGYKNDWDGNSTLNKVGTTALPVGTYFFLLEYGKNNHKTGYVYLVR